MFLATLQHLTACLALTGLVHAAPSSLAPRTTTNAVAEFEDIRFIDPAASVQAIGEYKNVYWNAFRLVTAGIDGTLATLGIPSSPATKLIPDFGVVPHTPPRLAAFGVVSETEDGTTS